jgi:hypothetical protein
MPTPTRATALASRLSDYRGWNLLPHCARCRVMRQISIARLADQVGKRTLLRDVLPRLRCHTCGNPPRAMKLSDGGGVSNMEVWVLGAAR